MNDAGRQMKYYEMTADHYDAMHVDPLDEHGMALALLAGMARHLDVRSILDVGAGTGRALRLLQSHLPDCRLVGIEPVEALREVGYANGIARDALIEGRGDALPFADDAFDMVIETGMLHHVEAPARVVREMSRVASRGVMLSDSNNFGQGSRGGRTVKAALRALGLWRLYIWATTRGRMSKYSEGDGVFYSYSLFDNLPEIAAKFPRRYLVNTGPLAGMNLRRGTSHAAIIALREPW